MTSQRRRYFVCSLTLILGLFFTASSQPSTLKALKLDKESTEFLVNSGYSFIKMDSKGYLLPMDGYNLTYDAKSGDAMLAKNGAPANPETVTLRGGMDFFCSGCEEEKCKIERAPKGVGSKKNTVKLDCLGCFKADGSVEPCQGSLLIRKVTIADMRF